MTSPRLRQWLWFVGLWAGSVLVLGIVASLLRAILV